MRPSNGKYVHCWPIHSTLNWRCVGRSVLDGATWLMDWDGRSVCDGVRSLKGVIQSATIILACMWVGDYCMTSQSIHNGQGHSTGHSVANRSPAGTRWPDEDGVLSRRVSGLQRGKVTERCGSSAYKHSKVCPLCANAG